MKKFFTRILLFCGLALMLAAFPVFAQPLPAKDVEINKKPLLEFADLVIDKLQKKEIALSESFLIELNGELANDGKLDRQKTRFVRADGSEQMVNIGKSLVESLNESSLFGYLRQLDIERFNLIFAQNDAQLYAIVKSDTVSAEKAKTISSGLNMAVSVIKQKPKTEDDKILLNRITVSAQENFLILKIALEKPIAQEMIQRILTEEINKRLAKANSDK